MLIPDAVFHRDRDKPEGGYEGPTGGWGGLEDPDDWETEFSKAEARSRSSFLSKQLVAWRNREGLNLRRKAAREVTAGCSVEDAAGFLPRGEGNRAGGCRRSPCQAAEYCYIFHHNVQS